MTILRPGASTAGWAVALIVAGLGLIAGGLVVGGLVVGRPGRSKPPSAAPQTVPSTAPQTVPSAAPAVVTPPARPSKPRLVEVAFDITSEPPGATVRRDGEALGRTPLRVTWPREGTDPLRVELTFSLEGYQDASLTALGLDGRVPVHQLLVKRAPVPSFAAPRPPPRPTPTPPKKPANPPGYKDDPYQ